MSDEEQVRAASDAFYRALHDVCHRDAGPMRDVWHHSDRVSTVHPMGDWVYGWEQVWATWRELAHVLSEGTIEVRGMRIQVLGDVALATCTELVSLTIGERAVTWSSNVTNIFTRENGQWRMLHHHADKAPSAERAIDEMTG